MVKSFVELKNIQMLTSTFSLSFFKKDCGKSYPYSAKKHKRYSIFLKWEKCLKTINSIKNPRSVAVNHAGLWIRRHQFESGRGYTDTKLESHHNSF